MTTPAAASLRITHSDHEQRPVLVLAGDLDATTAPEFAAAATEIVEQGARDVIVDTSGLTHCDPGGLSVFVQVAGRLRSRAGRLAIVAPSPAMRQALDENGLGDAFMVTGSVAAALYAIHRDHP
jgi:anti-sigma B factor antagonist